MRKLILVAASVVALGMAGTGVGYAARITNPSPTGQTNGWSAAGRTTVWMCGYGIPCSPSRLARIQAEQKKFHATSAQPKSLGTGAPV
jgi:hypothetical protein